MANSSRAGHDADCFRALPAERGTVTVTPYKPTRVIRYPLDRALCRERRLVECFFNKLKSFRRLATRYDKTARAYLATPGILPLGGRQGVPAGSV